MMRKKTIKKLVEEINRQADRSMREKYGNSYKTRVEILREARKSQKRLNIVEIILLAQRLQREGRLNEEITKLSNKQNSEFDKFLY